MPNDSLTVHIETLSQQHQLLGVAKPRHPMFSILRFEDVAKMRGEQRVKLISDFYQITLKADCPCKLKYGQTPYDFDEGTMSFFLPKQVTTIEPGDWTPSSGWLLLIHPDFLRGFPLSQRLKAYGFFDYGMAEALILSSEEDQLISDIFNKIEKEYLLPIDNFSQEVIIANIELLLTYCNRYYNRQFIVRKPASSELLAKTETILNAYLKNGGPEKGLPTASYLASQLHLSPKYLSDCLKQLTGHTTQQLIHDKLIEHAKDLLTTTELSVSEIAYELGFEHSQSFSKLFKSKTNCSPLAFRTSFN